RTAPGSGLGAHGSQTLTPQGRRRSVPPVRFAEPDRKHEFVLPDGVRADAIAAREEGILNQRGIREAARCVWPDVAWPRRAARTAAGRIRRPLCHDLSRLQYLGSPR